MALVEDLRALQIDATDKAAVLRWISALPISASERIRRIREYELTLSTAIDPAAFHAAAQGRYL